MHNVKKFLLALIFSWIIQVLLGLLSYKQCVISLITVQEEDIGYIDVTTDTTPTMIRSWWADTTPATCEE